MANRGLFFSFPIAIPLPVSSFHPRFGAFTLLRLQVLGSEVMKVQFAHRAGAREREPLVDAVEVEEVYAAQLAYLQQGIGVRVKWGPAEHCAE